MDPQTLIALACAIGVICIGLIVLDGRSDNNAKRVKSITSRGQMGRKGLFAFIKEEGNANRRQQIESTLQNMEARKKNKKKAAKTLKSKLIQAGWETTDKTFIIISVMIGVFIMVFLLAVGIDLIKSAGAGFVVGFGFPRWFLNGAVKRRQKKFTENFADAMDIIVRGVRTGLPLGDCLKIIAHEAAEPVATEFSHVIEEESVGVPIDICLERLYERVPLSEVSFFATALNIQKSTGGNLGEALSNLSNVLRGRKILREKVKSLSAEAKASAWVVGFLPIGVGFLVTVAAPDYMSDLYNTETGQKMLMVAAGMMTLGIVIIRKMIDFKV